VCEGSSRPVVYWRLSPPAIGQAVPEARWALAVSCLAHLVDTAGSAPTSGAQPASEPFGQALTRAGYPEARLEAMLAASGAAFARAALAACRYLGAKAATVDGVEVALWLLAEPGSASATGACRAIAESYYDHVIVRENSIRRIA
jgi:hypothetical protein